MNARQFFDLVAEMRNAQRNYFALRKAGASGKAAEYQGFSIEAGFDAFSQKFILTVRGRCSRRGSMARGLSGVNGLIRRSGPPPGSAWRPAGAG